MFTRSEIYRPSLTLSSACLAAVVASLLSTCTVVAFAQTSGVSGRVVSGSGDPVPASVWIWRSDGSIDQFVTTDPLDGTFSAELPSGSYYLSTSAIGVFVDEVYDNLVCLGTRPSPFTNRQFGPCDVTTGSVVTIEPDEVVAGIDFVLESSGVSGTLANELSQPITGVITAWDDTGRVVNQVQATGPFQMALAPGGYFLTSHNDVGFVDERYDGAVCLGRFFPLFPFAPPEQGSCDVAGGDIVSVTAENVTTGISFLLEESGASGTVRNDSGGQIFPDPVIEAYDQNGNFVAAFYSGAGSYAAGLPAGTYFVRTSSPQYADEVFDDTICPDPCSAAIGDPVDVAAMTTTTGIDFRLRLSHIFVDGFESGDTTSW